MLQLISGSTRRKANKCEPLLSRAGKETEAFPSMHQGLWEPAGEAAWIFEKRHSGETVSLFLSGILSPPTSGGRSGETKSVSGVERVDLGDHDDDFREGASKSTGTQRVQESRLTSTSDRGSRRNLGNPQRSCSSSSPGEEPRLVASLRGGADPIEHKVANAA